MDIGKCSENESKPNVRMMGGIYEKLKILPIIVYTIDIDIVQYYTAYKSFRCRRIFFNVQTNDWKTTNPYLSHIIRLLREIGDL